MRRTRNDIPFYYALYDKTETITDEYGNETGTRVYYQEPVLMYANISPATGVSQTEQFGNLENYDKVIVTKDMNCPIDENSVLYIDKEPEVGVTPKYDYIVRRVAKGLNAISIAVKKVAVS